tara:strand:- start:261 stop:476 length:216 start_codon:yes stop_codon:yes gene_type:complete
MNRYENLNGDSGVSSYEVGPEYIRVKFNGTFRSYTYSYRKAGVNHVERMKALAHSGSGLSSDINRYVKKYD